MEIVFMWKVEGRKKNTATGTLSIWPAIWSTLLETAAICVLYSSPTNTKVHCVGSVRETNALNTFL